MSGRGVGRKLEVVTERSNGLPSGIPEDLSPQAVKVARRIQSLPSGQSYDILLVKDGSTWLLSVGAGRDIERS